MKKTFILLFLLALFYMPILLEIQKEDKKITSITTFDYWENVTKVTSELTYFDIFGSSLFGNDSNNLFNNSQGPFYIEYKYYINSAQLGIGKIDIIKDHHYYISINIEQLTGTVTGQFGRIVTIGNNGYKEIVTNSNNSNIYIMESATLEQAYIYFYSSSADNTWILKDLLFFDLTEIFGSGNEPSVQQMDYYLEQYKKHSGSKTVGSYQHETETVGDIDGYYLGDMQVRSLFVFLSNPITIINDARIRGGNYIGDVAYQFVNGPLETMIDNSVETVVNSFNDLWLNIKGLGNKIIDTLTFWN